MISFAGAKINVGLSVLNKRDDGYHNVQMTMLPIPLFDIIEIMPRSVDCFNYTGISFDHSFDLCLYVLRFLRKYYKVPPVHMHIHKQIPVSAGLGGGTSDAVSVYKTLKCMFNIQVDVVRENQMLALLGMDARFFMNPKPALATQKGDVLQTIEWQPKGKYLLLVNDGTHISTQWAYEHIKPGASVSSVLDQLENKIPVNDFEDLVLTNYPKLLDIKNKILSMGALQVGMTGTGSTLFGFFETKPTTLLLDTHLWTRILEL